MDISPLGILCNWLPQLPNIVSTSILAFLGRSPNSEHQGALTEIIVAAARPILQTPAPLLRSQRQWTRDPGIWGRMWVTKYTVPKPEDPTPSDEQALGLRDAVKFAIEHLSLNSDDVLCPIPEVTEVETEWTGYRANVSPVALRPNVPEAEMYTNMMREVDPAGPTILYFHGGAFCLMDPATHRFTTSALARDSGGRAMSVRYRLSPQHPFPAALLDGLVAYLALLHPPPGAYHKPISASQIVLAGDSSGGNLATALLLLLLTLNRHNITISLTYPQATTTKASTAIHVSIPNPTCAGLALASPWLDISRSLPSTTHNSHWDLIAPPPPLLHTSSFSSLSSSTPAFPSDSIWPANPPRAETYVPNATLVTHPLVSPVAAQSHLWRDAPPVYVNIGWEGMQDEAEIFARRVYEGSSSSSSSSLQPSSPSDNPDTNPIRPAPSPKCASCTPPSHNTTTTTSNTNHPLPASPSSPPPPNPNPSLPPLTFQGYTGMPHAFAVLPWNQLGRTAQGQWARFCRAAVQSASASSTSSAGATPSPHPQPNSLGVHHTTYTTPDLIAHPIRPEDLGFPHGFAGYDRGNFGLLTDERVGVLLGEARGRAMRVEEGYRVGKGQ